MLINLESIIKKVNAIEVIGSIDRQVSEIKAIDQYNGLESALYWVSDKNISIINTLQKGIIICSLAIKKLKPLPSCTYVIVDNPRQAFQIVLTECLQNEVQSFGIDPSSHIGSNVVIGNNVRIGKFNVIESGCIIEDDVTLGHSNVLHQNTVIQKNAIIGSHNTIGGTGFGYEKDKSGNQQLIPHIGNVLIKSNVHIGNNCCIDRAVLGSTTIGHNVKVDNLVHIAHGVQIMDNSLIIANSMIGGSSIIGKNVWLSPSCSILNKLHIKDNALVGMGAVVIDDVDENVTVVGNPARKIIKK